jgi:hypothetical protein
MADETNATYLALRPNTWGKGKTSEEAMFNCMKESGSMKGQPFVVYAAYSPDIYVDDFGTVHSPVESKAWKVGTFEEDHLLDYVTERTFEAVKDAVNTGYILCEMLSKDLELDEAMGKMEEVEHMLLDRTLQTDEA